METETGPDRDRRQVPAGSVVHFPSKLGPFRSELDELLDALRGLCLEVRRLTPADRCLFESVLFGEFWELSEWVLEGVPNEIRELVYGRMIEEKG